MTPVESDLRRMVSNAKSFNEKSSDIFSDAEKIRKLVSSTMQKINPAYADKSYAPFATPIPDVKFEEIKKQVDIQDVDAEGETDPEVNEKPKRPITIIGPSSAIATNGRRASSTPAVQDAEDAGQSFDGNTFQQAQEKIMTELMKLENDEYVGIFTSFHTTANIILQRPVDLNRLFEPSTPSIARLLPNHQTSSLSKGCAEVGAWDQRKRKTDWRIFFQELARI